MLITMLRCMVSITLLCTCGVYTLPPGYCLLELLHLKCTCSEKVESYECPDRCTCEKKGTEVEAASAPNVCDCPILPNACCPKTSASYIQLHSRKSIVHDTHSAQSDLFNTPPLDVVSPYFNSGSMARVTLHGFYGLTAGPPLYLKHLTIRI